MAVEDETNLVNNVVPKPEKLDEPSRRNTNFIRLRFVPDLSLFQQDV